MRFHLPKISVSNLFSIQICRDGITRDVILTKKYAIKLPKIRYVFKYFLLGMLANLNEKELWGTTHSKSMCPVLFSLSGFLVVMPRVVVLKEELSEEEQKQFWEIGNYTDIKADNFGRLDGRLVCVDYGGFRTW